MGALSIHIIVLWASISLGMAPSSSGAAVTTTFAANRRSRLLQQILTTARMGSQIGRRAGRSPRRSGAVGFMARAARIKVAGAPHPHPLPPSLSRTTAMPDLPTGCRVGLLPKRHGAVRTRGRAALQRLEDVPDRASDRR